MEFICNYDLWKIEEIPADELKELYKKNTYEDEEILYVFGVTIKSQHIIYINKDMCFEQKIKTLKHELAHCYIWQYGLYNVPSFNEEMVCDLVSRISDWLSIIVKEYKELNKR